MEATLTQLAEKGLAPQVTGPSEALLCAVLTRSLLLAVPLATGEGSSHGTPYRVPRAHDLGFCEAEMWLMGSGGLGWCSQWLPVRE